MENKEYTEKSFEYIVGKTRFITNLFFEKGTKNTLKSKLEKAAKIDLQCGFETDDLTPISMF